MQQPPYFHIHYNSSFITTLPCPRHACELKYCQWFNACGSKPNLTGGPLLSMYHVLSRYMHKCDFIYAHKDVSSLPKQIFCKTYKLLISIFVHNCYEQFNINWARNLENARIVFFIRVRKIRLCT